MNFLHWPLLVVKRLNGHQGLVSIAYSIGQALAAGPNSKFNYFSFMVQSYKRTLYKPLSQ